ncbi:MAG: RNA 2',3'-cyclic phosphodiesterase [Bacteroidales bacterium]|nr:RNA 2',3'-cyclic phosphodiesterase [Bacteroidales bacterium]
MKRTFLAISIPSGTEYPLLVQQLQKKLQHEQKNINWCKPNQIHLTLKFVGETADQDVPAIIEACQKVARNHKPFSMDFNRTGLFGSNRVPRVLWLGMQDTPKALYDLEADLLDAFDSVGYMRDRQNFVPHLTVCRIKYLVDKQLFLQVYESIEQKTYLHADVKDLVYFQSFLQPSGPYYKVLKKIPLG